VRTDRSCESARAAAELIASLSSQSIQHSGRGGMSSARRTIPTRITRLRCAGGSCTFSVRRCEGRGWGVNFVKESARTYFQALGLERLSVSQTRSTQRRTRPCSEPGFVSYSPMRQLPVRSIFSSSRPDGCSTEWICHRQDAVCESSYMTGVGCVCSRRLMRRSCTRSSMPTASISRDGCRGQPGRP